MGLLLLLIAGVIGTIGALGHLFTSISAIYQHFSYEIDIYWLNRLLASQILGSTGLFFGVLVFWMGVYLFTRKDKDVAKAGQVLLFISMLPHLVSFITLPLLTPSDWPHMITHGVVIVFLLVGIFLRKKP